MIPRPDLLPPGAPTDIEVFQLTCEHLPCSHVYMEAQVFTPDSKRFVLHRSAHAHGSDRDDPEHRYLVCDLDDHGAMIPITDELGAKAPAVSPDGQYVYYFVDQTDLAGGRLLLKRVRIDGSERQTLFALEGSIGPDKWGFSRAYPISTISSDGRRIAYSGFLGDGTPERATWGFLVFDIERGTVSTFPLGKDWFNLHPQYSRSLDPEASHDLLIQHNHGSSTDPVGDIIRANDGLGADIHVIRDDGTRLRDMPWGRDGNEACQGHQCWIGRTERAITSTVTRDVSEAQIIEGLAAPEAGHLGRRTPAAVRFDLSRNFPKPRFYHFATDIHGRRFITDYKKESNTAEVYVADFAPDAGSPLTDFRLVAMTRGTWEKGCHTHPFLSPDGTTGFFNSNESGILQAYMVRGF